MKIDFEDIIMYIYAYILFVAMILMASILTGLLVVGIYLIFKS